MRPLVSTSTEPSGWSDRVEVVGAPADGLVRQVPRFELIGDAG